MLSLNGDTALAWSIDVEFSSEADHSLPDLAAGLKSPDGIVNSFSYDSTRTVLESVRT
jgi:hypothetical protein